MTKNKNSNLIPLNARTQEERKKITSAGGKASAIARKQKASMKEIAETFLHLTTKKGKKTGIENLKSLEDLDSANMDLKSFIVLQQIKKACEGDLKSAEWLQNLIGEGFDTTIIQTTTEEEAEFLTALKTTIKKKNDSIIDYKIEDDKKEDK